MNELLNFDKNLIQSDLIYNRFTTELDTFNELNKVDRIIVAVSGGLDSMALFYLLMETNSYDLQVAHVNHNLRPESEGDEKFVEKICDENSISFHSINLDPSTMEKGESVEQWARNHRYTFLKETAEKTESKWIMTAHHGNDQVETILMNLSRQTGVSGLRGIAKQRGNILRPLLGFSKEKLLEFVERTGIPFREDATNSDLSIPRNFIRHRVIQPWEKENPQLISGVQHSVEHFSDWKKSLDYFIVETVLPNVDQSDKRIEIPLNLIHNLPKMAKIRLVQILTSNNQHEFWSKHEIDMMNAFLQKNETGNQIHLLNGWSLLKDRETIIGRKDASHIQNNAVELVPNHPVEFDNYRYEMSFKNSNQPKSIGNLEQMDWSVLKNLKLEIRTWKDGDSFQPLGMKGHQKISDFLINEKVDRFAKDSQTVITANDEIIWVCGKRIADWVKLTKHTKKTVNLSRSRI
jgi:tRNA(Ile)-lysidine synthase